jgi:DEAD/DEAH box helicase domain-containing protein
VPAAGRGPAHGEVHVVSRVVGFKKIKFYTNENVGSGRAGSARAADAHDVVLADDSARADGALPYGTADRRDGISAWRSRCATSRRCCSCAIRHDLGLSIDGWLEGASRLGRSAARRRRTELSADPTIFLYDNYPGRHRLQRAAVRDARRALARTRELIEAVLRVGLPVVRRALKAPGPARESRRLARAPSAGRAPGRGLTTMRTHDRMRAIVRRRAGRRTGSRA